MEVHIDYKKVLKEIIYYLKNIYTDKIKLVINICKKISNVNHLRNSVNCEVHSRNSHKVAKDQHNMSITKYTIFSKM